MLEKIRSSKGRLTALLGVASIIIGSVLPFILGYMTNADSGRTVTFIFLLWGVGVTALASGIEISKLESRIKTLEEKLEHKNI